MKKLFNVIISTVLVLSLGCGKKDGGNAPDKKGGYMSCKMNGKLYEFNAKINANDKPDGTVHFVVISGWEKDGDDYYKSPSFGISLLDPKKAEAKTYTTPLAGGIELDGQYCVQSYKGDVSQGTTCYMSSRSDVSGFSLTITKLDDWGVTGTFSGVLKNYQGVVVYTVTDGKFSAPYN